MFRFLLAHHIGSKLLNPEQKQKIIRYYRKPESRWGYHHFLWGAKHFGYYPDKKANISERKAQQLLQDLVAQKLNLKSGMKILDAGCGEGVVATYLAKNYDVSVTGVTLVPFEENAAKKRSQISGTSGKTNFLCMDYTNTSFADETFDAVYTTESLSHIPKPSDALGEFFRILKPGGKIALFEYTIAENQFFATREKKMLDLVIDESGMFGLENIRHDKLVNDISEVGFIGVMQENISDNIKPSFRRLNKSAKKPYRIISKLGLRRIFINTTASVEYFKMVEKDLIRYYIFTAQKPTKPR